jgi:signal transduction histidine kinase
MATAQPGSRSRRLFRYIFAAVSLAELLIFVAALDLSRRAWLDRKLLEAELAATATGFATPQERLRQVGVDAVRVEWPGHAPVMLGAAMPPDGVPALDLRRQGLAAGAGAAVSDFVLGRQTALTVEGAGAADPSGTVTAVLAGPAVSGAVREAAGRIGLPLLVLAFGLTGVLYAALVRLLVHPLRRVTHELMSLADVPPGADEAVAAARAVDVIKEQLSAAHWRQARLAALGVAVIKTNHDLRGVLSPALLTAERLQSNSEPAVKRAGDVLVRAVERAAEIMKRTVELVREIPIAPAKAQLNLRRLAEAAAERARASCKDLAVENGVPDTIDVEADRDCMLRAFANLLLNAAAAGAGRARISADYEGNELVVTVTDNGPGLPEPQRDKPFRPPAHLSAVTQAEPEGARGPELPRGLGLPLVRDLMRAQGGEASLLLTGPGGTTIQLTLPAARSTSRPAARPAVVRG